MGIAKVSSILWMLRHPVITIFEQDMEEWLRATADKVSFRIYKENAEKSLKYLDRRFDEENYALEEIAEEAAEREIEKIDEKIIGYRHVVLVEGKFGTGERQGSLEDISDIIDSLWKGLTIEIWNALREGIWTRGEIERIDKQGKTNFERTLSNYIPSIFEDDLSDWEEEFPNYIVYRVTRGELSWGSPERMIKEEIRNKIDRIAEELENLNSRYVNIVEGEYSLHKTATCQIITVTEFIDRLYKTAYDRSLEILAEKQSEPKGSELDEGERFDDITGPYDDEDL